MIEQVKINKPWYYCPINKSPFVIEGQPQVMLTFEMNLSVILTKMMNFNDFGDEKSGDHIRDAFLDEIWSMLDKEHREIIETGRTLTCGEFLNYIKGKENVNSI